MENVFCQYLEKHFDEVSPQEFYRDVFPSGELEEQGQFVTGKYTGIIVAVTDERKPTGQRLVKRYSVCDDLAAIDRAVSSEDFCLMSPLSYAGKRRTAENARFVYAIAVDLDRIRKWDNGGALGLENLWELHINELHRIPCPSYIVSSGTGLHLYYLLDKPCPLYGDIPKYLQELKRHLTRLIWHDSITDIKSWQEIQQEGIYQGFRVVGTVTKVGTRARAFKTGDRVDLNYLYSFIPAEYAKGKEKLMQALHHGSREGLSLEEARKKYPEWYEKRIVEQQPKKKWAVNRNVYEWWLKKIAGEATVGHRYFCIMMLAVYAKKCSYYDEKKNPHPVTYEELEHDAFGLLQIMDSMSRDKNNPFTADDILSALEAFNENFVSYGVNLIQTKTAVHIEKHKRNGNNRSDHLEECRAIRDIRCKRRGMLWTDNSGRPSKYEAVQEWRELHPSGRKIDCITETGICKATVYKHWKRHSDEGKSNE